MIWMRVLPLLLILLIPNPGADQTIGPARQETATIKKVSVIATAYCLRGRRTASDKIVYPGCIALSRCLVKELKAHFGDVIVVEGIGVFVFDDLMPPQWRHRRVDIHYPTLRECNRFPNGQRFLVYKR